MPSTYALRVKKHFAIPDLPEGLPNTPAEHTCSVWEILRFSHKLVQIRRLCSTGRPTRSPEGLPDPDSVGWFPLSRHLYYVEP